MNIAEFFAIFPAPLATALIATLPIGELRAAIPISVGVYQLEPVWAYIFSVIGNIIPAAFIIWLIGPFSGYVMQRFGFANKFFTWLFARTRHKFSGKYEKWGELALVLFVAVPLPVTGAWTGSLAAFLFGIPKKKSLALITLGTMIAGVIVMVLTLGTGQIINLWK